MGPVLMIVADVLSHEPLQMPLVQNDHLIQQVSSATSNPTFRNPVLPRAPEGGAHGQASHLARERHHVIAELGVAVEQQESMGRAIGPGFPHLLHDPKCRGISRNVAVENLAPLMTDDEKAVEDAKR